MNDSPPVRTSPALRLLPPSPVTGGRWIARDVLERRGYRLTREAAAALVAAFLPAPAGELARRLAGTPGSPYDRDRWEALIATLRDRGLLVDEAVLAGDPRYAWLTDLQRRWSQAGWREAAEYHVATFDYPCVDYADATGWQLDRERMRRYHAAEPDEDRYKLDYVGHEGVPLPAVEEVEKTATAREVWREGAVPPTPLDGSALKTLLSLTFGATGQRETQTVPTPLLLRTSPSGGARHPTEGYVVVRAVDGVARGWYHVTMRPFSLRRVNDLAGDDHDLLDRVFPDTRRRAPFPPRAIVVLTSVFERNMYRYREPRTFRTVHMDAGHLAGTLALAARSIGVRSVASWDDDACGIERALGCHGMREGYMLTVALGDGAARTRE